MTHDISRALTGAAVAVAMAAGHFMCRTACVAALRFPSLALRAWMGAARLAAALGVSLDDLATGAA